LIYLTKKNSLKRVKKDNLNLNIQHLFKLISPKEPRKKKQVSSTLPKTQRRGGLAKGLVLEKLYFFDLRERVL